MTITDSESAPSARNGNEYFVGSYLPDEEAPTVIVDSYTVGDDTMHVRAVPGYDSHLPHMEDTYAAEFSETIGTVPVPNPRFTVTQEEYDNNIVASDADEQRKLLGKRLCIVFFIILSVSIFFGSMFI